MKRGGLIGGPSCSNSSLIPTVIGTEAVSLLPFAAVWRGDNVLPRESDIYYETGGKSTVTFHGLLQQSGCL